MNKIMRVAIIYTEHCVLKFINIHRSSLMEIFLFFGILVQFVKIKVPI